MRKILIFSASTGGGHNQAALSLTEEFRNNGYETVKVDMLKETSSVLNILIADGYKVLANRMPKIYGGLYKLSDFQKLNNGITRPITKAVCGEIGRIILNHKPDLIIGTHAFIVDIVGRLKRKGIIDVPFISIVTDFEAHQAYVNDHVDAYITGSDYTCESLVNKGLPRTILYPYGIPIRREFLENNDKEKNENRTFQILLMGGSMGIKSMRKVFKNLLEITSDFKLVVVCGSDEALKGSVENHLATKSTNKEVLVYGFTDKIAQLMDESDIIITKPGGLTVTESIVKNIPMIIPYLIPGQEEENAGFLVKAGVAIKTSYKKEIGSVVNFLIENPEELQAMRSRMKELSRKYSTENLVKLADKLISEYEYKWGRVNEK